MYDKAAKLFEVPDIALPFMDMFLRTEELHLLEMMEPRNYSPDELLTLLRNFTEDPDNFIKEAYSRGVFNKAEDEGKVFFRPANFYTRLAFLRSTNLRFGRRYPRPNARKSTNGMWHSIWKRRSPASKPR